MFLVKMAIFVTLPNLVVMQQLKWPNVTVSGKIYFVIGTQLVSGVQKARDECNGYDLFSLVTSHSFSF